MKLVDMTDSKSVAFTGVAVQVRPLVPSLFRDPPKPTYVGFFVL